MGSEIKGNSFNFYFSNWFNPAIFIVAVFFACIICSTSKSEELNKSSEERNIDVSGEYLLKINGLYEHGQYKCEYFKTCIESKSTDPKIAVTIAGERGSISGHQIHRLTISIINYNACCVFSNGEDTINIFSDEKSYSVQFFNSRDKLYTNNKSIGTFYIILK